MPDQNQQQHLLAIINACGNAVQAITNYSNSISDPNQISICIAASQQLYAISTEATQALQAQNDAVYQQEVAQLRAASQQMQTQVQTLKQTIQVTGTILQIVSAVLQIAGLIAAL